MKKWYQLGMLDDDNAELLIYGDITSFEWYNSDKSAYGLAQDLAELNGANLTVRINSCGGEVAEGLAMYNLLKSYKGEVTTVCDGFACSAASIVFLAGSKRLMPKSSLLMIHNAWTTACGDSNELRKIADDIEKITQPSIEIYKSTSNLDEDQIKEMMNEETWILADEALNYGFATEVIEDSVKKQSLRNEMISKLVVKTKQLEKEVKEYKSKSAIENGWFF